MDEIFRLSAIALVGTICALTLKKHSAEAALLVSIATGVLLLTSALFYVNSVTAFFSETSRLMPFSDLALSPLIKSVGISIVTKITAELCRDGGEGALASKTELAGTAATVVVMIPLLRSVLDLIASLLK